jgi:hypothetical protein
MMMPLRCLSELARRRPDRAVRFYSFSFLDESFS